MEDKLCKCRVTANIVMDVWTRCPEDNAGAMAEAIAHNVVTQLVGDIDSDEDCSVSAYGVQCIDVEPYEEGE